MKKALFLTMMFLPVLLVTAAPFLEEGKLADAIRKDHPRLYINKDTRPAFREQAKKMPKEFKRLKRECDYLLKSPDPKLEFLTEEFEITPENRIKFRDRTKTQAWMLVKTVGAFEALKLATMYQLTGEQKYADKGVIYLKMAIEYFKWCYDHRVMVDWHTERRICAIITWDWLYEAMSPQDRDEIMGFLLYNILHIQVDHIPYREFNRNCYSGPDTGNYGLKNLCWFTGLAGIHTGIDEKTARELLRRGWIQNRDMIAYRDNLAETNGLLGNATHTYSMGIYAYASIHFLMTYQTATGVDITDQVTHLRYFPLWYDFMTIPAKPHPLSFGLGDLSKDNNYMSTSLIWTYMPAVCHLYPETAPLAMDLMQKTPEKQRGWHGWYAFWPFVFTKYDPTVEPKAPEISLAQYYKYFGMTIMRSGNKENDVYALFRTGAKATNHVHMDESHFTIYHRGFLALDSGSRTFDPQHHFYYSPQSVAHNTILIHQAKDDTPEPPAPFWKAGGFVDEKTPNYGGQNTTGKAQTIAYHHNGEYTYAANDASASYLNTKCKEAVRQFLYLRPNVFIVFDRVESVKPDQKKEYLLHFQNEPTFPTTDTVRAVNGEGVIFQKTILPENAAFKTVGGPGKQFMVGDKNYPLPGGDEAFTKHPENAYGAWRIELTDPVPKTRNYFLNVIEVGSKEQQSMTKVEKIGDYGVRVKTADGTTYEAAFQPTGEVVCSLRAINPDGTERYKKLLKKNF